MSISESTVLVLTVFIFLYAGFDNGNIIIVEVQISILPEGGNFRSDVMLLYS